MDPDPESEWWSLKKAAAETGYTVEAIRKWANGDRVRSQLVYAGQRSYRQVLASDVRRERSRNLVRGAPPAIRRTPTPPSALLGPDQPGYLRDRVASLEEVVRRYRHIDELREQIAALQEQIGHEHREIEIILQGPSMVPDSLDRGGRPSPDEPD